MIKKFTVILAILVIAAFGACTCWGYTAGKWPVPGIPNEVFTPGSATIGDGLYGGYGWYGYPGNYGGYYGGYVNPGFNGGYYGGYGPGYDGRGRRR